MLELIRNALQDFNNVQTQTTWFPYLIAYIVLFSLLIMSYISVHKSKLMNKVFYVHGFTEKKDDDVYNVRHFHNTDLIVDNFNLDNKVYKEKFEWVGKHYLFIPNGKINTLTKKRKNLTVWYNGQISKGFKYRVKHLQRNWIERRLSKKKVTNYNGIFIIGNLMVRTLNLSSIKIDSRNKREFNLTYLFDNGSERQMTVSTPEFFDNMVNNVVPYNVAFLSQCEVIELR